MKFPKAFPKKKHTPKQIKSGNHPEVSVYVFLNHIAKRDTRLIFFSKVTDSDMENSETSGWLDFALECKYIDGVIHRQMIAKNEEIGRLLNHMINNPDKY